MAWVAFSWTSASLAWGGLYGNVELRTEVAAISWKQEDIQSLKFRRLKTGPHDKYTKEQERRS